MVNMGPQHPSTHGVFRMVMAVDGEVVVDVEPHIGYLHRGSEKLSENELYVQVVTLFDRLDYISNLNNEMVFCRSVEKLMGLEIPERAEYIRVILCELNRVASHLLFFGTFGLDAGAMTPVMYTFREREKIQSMFEMVTGARMMHNYIRIGGVKNDVPEDFHRRMHELIAELRKGVEYNFNNPIVGSGSCIFIHLTKNYQPTAGCISLKKKDFLIMLKLISKKTKIKIS